MCDDDDNEDDWTYYLPSKKTNTAGGGSRDQKLKDRIKASGMPGEAKSEALQRLTNSSSDKEKIYNWVENLLKLPFGKTIKLPVSTKSSPASIKRYFQKVTKTLDQAVYGMKPVKEEVVNYIAQFISTNSTSMPRILGLCGSPGIGKTAIIRKGFAAALNRPMVCMSMGGVRDSGYFVGHDYTYVGSKYGCIAQNLIKLNCMNGIMFMDEVDKVSDTPEGREISNMLLHITDPMQNHSFQDKYFSGIELDLSKVIFIFSFNEEKLIDPILRDRIYVIKVPDPSLAEKVVISQDYLLNELGVNIGLVKPDIVLSNATIEHIIRTYCKNQQGVRGLKKCLESVLLKINTARYVENTYKCFKEHKVVLPFEVTISVVDELLVDCKPKEDKYISSMYI